MKYITIDTKRFNINYHFSSAYICSKNFKYCDPYYMKEKQKFICFTDNYKLNNNNVNKDKILLLLEPPQVRRWLNIQTDFNLFKYIFTHDINLISQNPNKFIFFPNVGTWIKPEDFKIYNKNKLISCILSNKNITTGHKLRHEVKNAFNNVDYYGKGANKFIDYKLTSLKDYMYSIVIENENIDDYFSEKIIDCFMTGTVPIYYGTKNIGKYFDINGIIMFNNIKDLEIILNNISESDYFSRMPAIKNNFNSLLLKENDYLADNYIFKKLEEIYKL